MRKVIKSLQLSSIIKKDFDRRLVKCLIFGNFGNGNLGEESILSGQLDEIRQNHKTSARVVSKYPDEVSRLHELECLNNEDFGTVLSEIKKSNLIIFGGGVVWKNCKNLRSILNQYYLLFYLTYAVFLKKKIYVIGLGLYLKNSIFSTLLVHLLKRVSLLSVRDYFTYKYLAINSVITLIHKDNSFMMNLLSDNQMLNDRLFKERYNKKRFNVGIALRRPDNILSAKVLSDEIVKFICKNHKDTDFWFYSLDVNPGKENDLIYMKSIASIADEKVKYKHNFYIMPTDWHPRKLFSSFKLMDFFITMRLHSSIFCHRNKIEFVGIDYHKKCESFLKSIDHDVYSLQDINGRLLQIKYKEFKNAPSLRFTRPDLFSRKRRKIVKKKKIPVQFFRVSAAA